MLKVLLLFVDIFWYFLHSNFVKEMQMSSKLLSATMLLIGSNKTSKRKCNFVIYVIDPWHFSKLKILETFLVIIKTILVPEYDARAESYFRVFNLNFLIFSSQIHLKGFLAIQRRSCLNFIQIRQ